MVSQGVFADGRVGRLMKMEDNELSRYEFEIWFEYTRRTMMEVRAGSMLAVRNFASTDDEVKLSVLEVTSLKPVHYALGDDPRGYPGFVMEAARNASQDWTAQEDVSDEDTTVIRCTAIPTNLELVLLSAGGHRFSPESNIPMVGSEALLLRHNMIQEVVNRGIDPQSEDVGVAGTWVLDARVNVLLRVADLIKVHFGIFGFTGVGKSNLVSTMIATVFPQVPNSKVVLFDLMGEYGTLLIDRLNTLEDGLIVCLGERSLPQYVFDYLNENPRAPNRQRAAQRLVNFFLLPKALVSYKKHLVPAFEELLDAGKVRVLTDVADAHVNDVCNTASERNPWRNRQRRGRPAEAISRIVRQVFGDYNQTNPPLTPDLATTLREALETALEENNAYRDDFDPALRFLVQIERAPQRELKCGITSRDLLAILDKDAPSLVIVLSHDPHELRRFSRRLGDGAYERRRTSGRIEPLVSFIFDEADEFIPRNTTGSYNDSKEIAETLARRGRKFGLGLGLATQRTRYLDTSIMGQPHTYFVSKLPRKTDRDVVAEAFGMSDEMLRQTFTFQTGNWLVVSHDATGLQAVPLPIQSENANDRIIGYLNTLARPGPPE